MDPEPNRSTQIVNVRICVPGDEHALSLVGQATFLESFAGVLSGDDILLHCTAQHSPAIYKDWLGESRARVWVAAMAAGHAPVGYLVVAPASLPLADLKDNALEVKRIYLLHPIQGTGVGVRLMREAVEFAELTGSRRLLLGVYQHNLRAIAFYERFGFTRIG